MPNLGAGIALPPSEELFRTLADNISQLAWMADPDFHQRFIATVERDRMNGRWEASEDAGITWRKDFDLIFERHR